MAKTYITWLEDVLQAASCSTQAAGDWRNRDSPGEFEPIGVLWHHTADAVSSKSNPAPALDSVVNGVNGLDGPLCHALIDYNGVFRLVSAGNANHAGESVGSGPTPAGDGNVIFVGWEIDYSPQNGQSISDAQYQQGIKGTAAVIRKLGTDASYVRGHKEIAPSRKIDPSGVDMDQVRADVAALLSSESPSPERPRETDVQLLRAASTWYVVDFGQKTFWAVTSSTLLRYLARDVGMRVVGLGYETTILSGFTRIA